MGWFWSESSNNKKNNSLPNKLQNDENDISLCPVLNNNNTDDNIINPLNRLPNISATKRQEGQKLKLTTERTISTIPRGPDSATTDDDNYSNDNKNNKDSKWEYPSAQQMYNAMVRRGKIDPNNKNDELQSESVEAMVQIHNFLNESCWYEILRWENPYTNENQTAPKLLRFMGKPGVLTPRARFHYYLGCILPTYFSKELPFDRHDWIVLRGDPKSNNTDHPGYKEIRYVLDFYGGPDDPNGMPTFSVDVRPALDNFTNVKDRFNHFTNPIINKYFPSSKTNNNYNNNNDDINKNVK